MIPPTKISIEKFLIAEDDSTNFVFYFLFFWCMHLTRDSPNSPKISVFSLYARYSNFKFTATTSSIFSNKITIENTTLVDEYSRKKIIVFLSCIRTLIARRFHREHFMLIFQTIQTHLAETIV